MLYILATSALLLLSFAETDKDLSKEFMTVPYVSRQLLSYHASNDGSSNNDGSNNDASNFESVDSRPNFILIMLDQWRFDWAGDTYENRVNISLNTPILDSIRLKGTRFVNAIVPSPRCAPTRSCIASGMGYDLQPRKISKNGDYDRSQKTIFSMMRNNGYWTMTSGKDDLTKKSGVGLNGDWRAQRLGFEDYRRCEGRQRIDESYPDPIDPFGKWLDKSKTYDSNGDYVSRFEIVHECNENCCNEYDSCPLPIHLGDHWYQDNWVTRVTTGMMDDIPSNKPWFLQINYLGSHPPFWVTKSMNESVGNRTFPQPMNSSVPYFDGTISRKNYAAMIENLDTQIGIIINKTREMGEYDNTVVCISADHGEMLGDFDNFAKHVPWVGSTNVPLLCMGPDVQANQTITSYVTNFDLSGTILDYTQTTPKTWMNTQSFRGFLNGSWTDDSNDYRDYVLSGLTKDKYNDRWRMAIKKVNDSVTWKYVCCAGKCGTRSNGRERFKHAQSGGIQQLLFNVNDDLYELNNLGFEYPDVVDEMNELIVEDFCVKISRAERVSMLFLVLYLPMFFVVN